MTFLFDLLHVDGEDLLDTPLEQRAARLEAVAPDLKIPGSSRPTRTRRSVCSTRRSRAGHEGVVVKDAASLYAAGRRGKAWRKVKPVRTYDLVVLGAEWGHGRREGWLSNLHLGARDPATGGFVMVGKCFKGLTDELLEWQTRELLERETDRQGDRRARAARARRRDRARRGAVLDALQGRRRAPLRAREALPAGQARRKRPTRSTACARCSASCRSGRRCARSLSA